MTATEGGITVTDDSVCQKPQRNDILKNFQWVLVSWNVLVTWVIAI